MDYIKFDDSLRVGNKIIDQEHAILIEYINLLQKAVENQSGDRVLHQVLQGLIEYTKTHFFVEEELMKAFKYPDYDGHKSAHEIFKKKIENLNKNVEQADMNISDSVLLFLKQWLTDHILKVDKKLSDFLADKTLAA